MVNLYKIVICPLVKFLYKVVPYIQQKLSLKDLFGLKKDHFRAELNLHVGTFYQVHTELLG